MAQNARKHARVCVLGLEYFILTYDPIYPKNVKMLKHNRPSISESTKPIDLKI